MKENTTIDISPRIDFCGLTLLWATATIISVLDAGRMRRSINSGVVLNFAHTESW